jgi:hypothetical protein
MTFDEAVTAVKAMNTVEREELIKAIDLEASLVIGNTALGWYENKDISIPTKFYDNLKAFVRDPDNVKLLTPEDIE